MVARMTSLHSDANLPAGAWDSDLDYCPTLTQAGRRMLAHLRGHPAAPVYRNRSGNKLLAGEVAALRAYEQEVMDAEIAWQPGEPPALDGGLPAPGLGHGAALPRLRLAPGAPASTCRRSAAPTCRTISPHSCRTMPTWRA